MYALAGFFVLFCLFLPRILNSHLISWDDPVVVAPMSAVHRWVDYLQLRQNGIVIDLQPVRDFSYVLDYRLSGVLGWNTFHLTQILIGGAILLVLGGLVSRVGILILAFHPVFVNSLGWLSARKHLLMMLFFLMAIRCWRKGGSKIFWVPVLFLLSAFSQPIAVIWPIWALLFYGSNPEERYLRKWIFGVTALLALGVAVLNLRYYSSTGYLLYSSGIPKTLSYYDFSHNLLVLGRSLSCLLLPWSVTGFDYVESSLYCLVGLIFGGGLIGAWIYQARDRKKLIRNLVCFLSPFLPILYRRNEVFIWDVYLLLPAVALLRFFEEGATGVKLRVGQVFAVGMIFFGIIEGASITRAWGSFEQVLSRAYQKEPTPYGLGFLVKNEFLAGQWSESYRHAEQLKVWQPENRELAMIYPQLILLHSGMSQAEKIDQLISFGKSAYLHQWTRWALAQLYFECGQYAEVLFHLERLENQSLQTEKMAPEGLPLEAVVAMIETSCSRLQRERCLTDLIIRIKKPSAFYSWNEDRHQLAQQKFKTLRQDPGCKKGINP